MEIEITRRLGDRVQPATGRHLIYLAARVVSGTPSVVDHQENSHFDWAELEGGIFPPVLAYLEATMGAETPAPVDE